MNYDCGCLLIFAVENSRTAQRLVGSLAGAAHLLNSNTGVPRLAHDGQKSTVEYKGKGVPDFDFQYKFEPRKRGLTILLCLMSL